jgi:hypothetical protein
LAGVKRISALEGFPVTDVALVAETDLDLDEIRDRLSTDRAQARVEVVPGEHEGSLQVTGFRGGAEDPADLGGD